MAMVAMGRVLKEDAVVVWLQRCINPMAIQDMILDGAGKYVGSCFHWMMLHAYIYIYIYCYCVYVYLQYLNKFKKYIFIFTHRYISYDMYIYICIDDASTYTKAMVLEQNLFFLAWVEEAGLGIFSLIWLYHFLVRWQLEGYQKWASESRSS